MNSSPPEQCLDCKGSVRIVGLAPAFDGDGTQFPLGVCNTCKLVTTQGVTADVLKAAYHSEYYGGGERKFSTLVERSIGFLTVRQARRLTAVWGGKSPVVLDIGCGRGVLLQAFSRQRAEVLGLERDEFPGRPDFVEIGALKDESYRHRTFDIIVIWHVLEHLESLSETIDEAHRHLNKGGILAIAIPNYGSWQARLFAGDWFHLDIPRHLLHITSDQLFERLENAGLEVVSESHWDPLQNIYGFIQSVMNRLFPNSQNRFYAMLKHGRYLGLAPLIGWMLLAGLLVPLAVLEYVISGIRKQGATVHIVAKR